MENIIKQKFSKIALYVVLVIAVVFAVYFYIQLYTLKKNPQAISQKETSELVSKVGKLVFLPKDEVPTIATVTDPNLLKEQPFFVNAQKGDKVLIYAQSKKAILYSVSLNKVIDVAPLNIGSSTKTSTPTPTQETTDTPVKK
ncbi:MAG: hypothetical protein WCO58_02005 [bacterium]